MSAPRGRPQRRSVRRPPVHKVRCQLDGSCGSEAVVRFIGTTLFGEQVVLYACSAHDAPWAETHPEMLREDSALMRRS